MKQYGSRREDNNYGHKEQPVHGEKSSRARAKRAPREKLSSDPVAKRAQRTVQAEVT